LAILEGSKMKREEEMFIAFWSVYPRRVGKGTARKAFAKALRSVSYQTIIDAVLAQLPANLNRDDPQFIPHPATWLNGERWGDDIEQPKQSQPRGIAGAAIRSMGNAGQNQGGYSRYAQLFFSTAKH